MMMMRVIRVIYLHLVRLGAVVNGDGLGESSMLHERYHELLTLSGDRLGASLQLHLLHFTEHLGRRRQLSTHHQPLSDPPRLRRIARPWLLDNVCKRQIPLRSRRRGGATGKAFGLAINRSQVQILLEVTLRNNIGQVVYTYVPLSPSSITWYRPKGGDALRLGR